MTPEIVRSIRAAYLRGFGEAKGLALVVCDESHDHSNAKHSGRTEVYLAEVCTAQWIATRIDQLKPPEST